MIEIAEVKSKKDLNAFVNLPWKIYKNDPNWVAPLKMAVKDLLNPKHPFFETAEQKNFLAFKNKECVGRISAVFNRSYNQMDEVQSKHGFWGFYECINDKEVSDALLNHAEKWLLKKDVKIIQGPHNPSTNYESGLLVNGFEDPPQIMMTYNPKYYQELIEGFGYTKAKDMLAYSKELDFEQPEIVKKVVARAEKRHNVTYRYLNKKNFSREVSIMKEIYNDAWENNWGFVPMTEKEFQHSAKDLKMVANERLIIFAEVNREPAGFIIGLPDLNQALKHNPSGNLLPFGIFKLLNHKKYCTRMRVPTLGIKHKFQKLGLPSLLYTKLQEEAIKAGLTEFEASWVLEDNLNMTKPLVRMGAIPYKTYRIYQRQFD